MTRLVAALAPANRLVRRLAIAIDEFSRFPRGQSKCSSAQQQMRVQSRHTHTHTGYGTHALRERARQARGPNADALQGSGGTLGGHWGPKKQETLIFDSETKAPATKKHKRRGCRYGARRVQGGSEYGSKGKWKSASAPRDHEEEDLKEDIN